MQQMLELPIEYFGQRRHIAEEIISWLRKDNGEKYAFCYDLFSGSASITIAAIGSPAAQQIARHHYINDCFPALTDFLEAIKSRPFRVGESYKKEYLKLCTIGPNYFPQALKEFNAEGTTDFRRAELLPLLLNFSDGGLPTFDKDNKFSPTISPELSADKLEYPRLNLPENFINVDTYIKRVSELSKLLKDNQTTITAKNFSHFRTPGLITSKDVVILDAPYPDDFSQKLYDRPFTVDKLHQELGDFITFLLAQEIPFILFYGANCSAHFMPDKKDYTEKREFPQLQHYLHSTNEEYCEHFYMPPYLSLAQSSASLPQNVVHSSALKQEHWESPKKTREMVIERNAAQATSADAASTRARRMLKRNQESLFPIGEEEQFEFSSGESSGLSMFQERQPTSTSPTRGSRRKRTKPRHDSVSSSGSSDSVASSTTAAVVPHSRSHAKSDQVHTKQEAVEPHWSRVHSAPF
ncbi:MAG: hypothetical protein DHS20C10_01750 [marine bacterium B5-7]|nr:MAG: hypothetical protein DHS20C10_01750 [marine bacterium B5-7]